MSFLHGIEIVEIADGVRPIRAARTSVIGVIGTAPGADDTKFPLDTPVLIKGRRSDAAGLGTTGTLPTAIDDIFDQAGCLVVVIRVEEGATDPDTVANVIGGIDGGTGQYLGVHAFLAANSIVHVTPKILCAPGFGSTQSVISEMTSIADRLRAVIIADGPNTTDAAAITARGNYGSDRIYFVDPWVKVFDTVAAEEVVRPASARIAGVIARTDQDKGFWWSPSNQLINGITGLGRAVEHSFTDGNSQSNLLNEEEVTTIIRADGYRIWGNRSCSSDPLWAFLSVRRTADMVYESVERGHRWALDRPFSPQLLNDIVDGVDAFLRNLKAQGAILGGKAWIDPELNTEATLKAGQLYIDFDIEPPAPLERLTFRAHRNDGYYTELVQSALAA
tara:strand:+ start:1314 stop:2486 length:1173 start_codon:yes stop_codon:yes gene_type:complete